MKSKEAASAESKIPRHEVHISAPWETDVTQCVMSEGGNFRDVERFLIDRSRVHERYIVEEAKTKRIALAISAILFLCGCLVIVFAPAGRESLATWIGASMLIVAGGVAGFKRVWAKVPAIDVGADEGDK